MIWYMNYGNLEFMLIEIKPFRRKIDPLERKGQHSHYTVHDVYFFC